ncbi:MAG: hypothetical protein KY455_08580 [Euryarchaeota archaeon]|nr:hypothetical protein [Euryarchaeota archaeon]
MATPDETKEDAEERLPEAESAGDLKGSTSAKEGWKPLASSFTVEKAFRVEGKKVTVRATIPATVGKELGMETVLAIAGRLIVDIESKQAKVVPLKLGEN